MAGLVTINVVLTTNAQTENTSPIGRVTSGMMNSASPVTVERTVSQRGAMSDCRNRVAVASTKNSWNR